MSRKRNPYIPLFTHDIMSSMKCRRLSMRATGLYLWLLCLMNEKPQQGRWALSTNEDHPTWKNSLTYRALQNADKYGRLPMFATLMARKFLPWKSGEVLKALQELYRFKLIVVEDDAIIQPRMYRDNGFKLREDTMREYLTDDASDPYDDPETELTEAYEKTMTADGKKDGNKGTHKGTNKVPQKVHEIHAHALRAESESENNINNSIGNIGGCRGNAAIEREQGDACISHAEREQGRRDSGQNCDAPQNTEQKKTKERPKQRQRDKTPATPAAVPVGSPDGKKSTVADKPPTQDEVTAYCQEKGYTFDPIQFWNHYEANGWVQGRNKPIRKWQACCATWQQREKNGEFKNYNNETANRHQQPYRGQSPTAGGHPDDDELLEQSARIIERKLRKDDGDSQ